MMKFYFNPAPNPMKVALFLEETGLPHEVVTVDTRKGEQHAPAYLAINPNAKAPSIDDDGTIVFDSNAILLYLAEKTGRFLPGPAERGAMLSWLMFVATGVGPYSGQCVHFRHFALGDTAYAVNRYTYEVDRHYRILDARLAGQEYLVADGYGIVDMDLWGWANMLGYVLGENALANYPNVARWHAAVSARPAAARALEWRGRYEFKKDLDDEARRALFPQNVGFAA